MAFMKWLSDELVAECAGLVEFAGDAAHVARNQLCGVNRAVYPELLCADTLSAQIEAITRDLKSLLAHRLDCTAQLRNASKCAECSLVNLDRFASSKDADQCSRPDWIIARTKLAASKRALAKVSKIFLTAVTGALADSLGMSVSIDIDGGAADEVDITPGTDDGVSLSSADGGTLDKMAVIDSDLWLMPEISSEDALLAVPPPSVDLKTKTTWLKSSSQRACNTAHQIQGEMCSFIRVAVLKDTANKIINLCGQTENQTRSMQAQLVDFLKNSKTHPDQRTLWTNMLKAVKKHANNVINKNREVGQMLAQVEGNPAVTPDFTEAMKRVKDEHMVLLGRIIDQIICLE